MEQDDFCWDPLWSSNITWYTTKPDLTQCFQTTVLAWVPTVFLILTVPFQYYGISKLTYKVKGWTRLTLIKLLFLTILAVVTLTELISLWVRRTDQSQAAVPVAEIVASASRLAAFILASACIIIDKLYARTASGVLFMYWLILSIAESIIFASRVRVASLQTSPDKLLLGLRLAHLPLAAVQLLLASYADHTLLGDNYRAFDANACPESTASFPNILMVWWLNRLAYLGWKRPLDQGDLWDTQPRNTAAAVVDPLENNWKRELDKQRRSKAYRPSILKALFRTHLLTLLGSSALRLVANLLLFVAPQIIQLLVGFMEGSNGVKEDTWKGYFYASIMFLAALLGSVCTNYGMQILSRVGMTSKAAIVSIIYRKSLRMTSAARQTTSVGEMVNLMSVDAQRFMDFVGLFDVLWAAPLQIILSLYFLYGIVGYAMFAGVAAIVITIPLNAYGFTKLRIYQDAQMVKKDVRIKLMNEMLNGMKVLKLYAWEEAFEQEVLKIRNEELKLLKTAVRYGALSYVVYCMTPTLIVLATFATYVLMDPANVLTPKTAFGALALINILRMPMSYISPAVTMAVQVSVAEKRISSFLQSDELSEGNVKSLPAGDPVAVSIKNGTFVWNSEDGVCLKNIDLTVKEGQLAVVVGPVGTGKSSLCSAILGLMEKKDGEVFIKERIAYVPQLAWIQNLTVEENILFGKRWIRNVIGRLSRRVPSNRTWTRSPRGDQTEIGERGANLSGGQRQRISLARAAYSEADVYIFDDPLSAVGTLTCKLIDGHLSIVGMVKQKNILFSGKHIFEHVIGPKGMLSGKTRLLVTHGIGFLPQTDQIIVMSNGKVSENGTYKELLARKGVFAEFLLTYLDEEEDEVMKDPTLAAVKEEILQEIGGLDRRMSIISNHSLQRVKDVFRRDSTLPSSSSAPMGKRTKDATGEIELVDLVPSTAGKVPPTAGKLVDKEKFATGRVKLSVYRLYARQMGLVVTAAMIVCFVVFTTLGNVSNVWLSNWAKDYERPDYKGNTEQRNFRLGIYGMFGALQLLFMTGFSVCIVHGRIRASKNLHQGLLYRILRSPISFFDTTPLGRIVNRFSSDISIIDTMVPQNIEFWLFCRLAVVANLVIISISLPPFAGVVIPLGILYYFVQRFYISTSSQLKRLESVSRSPIFSHFQESVAGTGVIIAMKETDRFRATNGHLIDKNNSSLYLNLMAARWISLRLEFLGVIIMFSAALFAVISRDQDWGISSEDVGLALSSALSISPLLNLLIWVTAELEGSIVSVERVQEYSEVPQEADWVDKENRPPSDWPTRGQVDFVGYHTRYRPGLDLVLTDLNSKITSGEKIGIVGRTGAGKSSMALSLFRLIEAASGHILIDDLDIAKIGLQDLRSRITILPQEPVLFTGTLRLNLDPFRKYSDEDLWHALHHSHLKSFVNSLPGGLEHAVVDGGENYSLGQRQLICLARALLRKTKILVLDEATAAIDLQTDDLIQQTIRNEFADCTILTIAHRINTIMDSTRIMVLDQGHIKEFDSPANLLANKSGIFYGLAKTANLLDGISCCLDVGIHLFIIAHCKASSFQRDYSATWRLRLVRCIAARMHAAGVGEHTPILNQRSTTSAHPRDTA
ncbi:Multidrug resistance-associated protein 1 [Hypsibius exemplaris]|uniref:ABC-type glutathione-S-conjugate transporter n=1 Tax=Hypsibius exemplaris TaxID=2072580 RepID=A0A1W0WII3_HYPEX|nr:Multidrug resistance-associated protein 1 [Hypsibius exemplaris]